jgi:hypothetical protein
VAALVISGGAVLTACAQQPDITVTTAADTVADDGETSLREAFARANEGGDDNIIVLAAGGTYDLTNCAAGALVHALASELTLMVDPTERATIHQRCTNSGILRSRSKDSVLVVNGVDLVGGPNNGATLRGAGIASAGRLRMTQSSVTGVNAGPGGTVIEGDTAGMTDWPEDFTFGAATSVTGNTGTGLRVRDGDVRVDGSSRFTGNLGHGIRLEGSASSLVVDRADVSGNGGWGVHATGAGATPVRMSGGHIDDNAAGGLFCSGCDVHLDRSSVSGNGANAAAGSGGGVVFLVDHQDSGIAGRLRLGDSQVSGNRAQRPGGGIFVGHAETSDPDADTSTSLSLTVVENNTTTGDGQHGGGVAVLVGSLSVERSEILSNTAGGTGSDGGGVYLSEAVSGVRPPQELHGGSSTFRGNHASGRGGGAFVDTTSVVEISDAFEQNRAGGPGGGAFLRGELDTLPQGRAAFTGNTSGGQGGGAYLEVSGALESALVQGNQATEGGGIFVGPTSDLTVRTSAIATNTASVQGGGIAVGAARAVDVVNSTLTGNAAPRGGGLSVGAEVPVVSVGHTTLADNISPAGANVASSGGLVETLASLLVRPLGGGTNCAAAPGDLSPAGFSWSSDTSCGVHGWDIISTEDPQLGPLADNGGPTPTRLPAPTSPVANRVFADQCTIATDQRHVARPQGPGCEPGAVEIG